MTAMTDRKFAEFFAVMSGVYGHKWVAQYGNQPDAISARVWNDGLDGLTLAQIATAVRYYKNQSVADAWPPSLPEFRGVALGVPTLAKAKHDLRTGNATPFSKVMFRFLDGYVFKQASYKDADRMAAEAYELAVACVTGGEPMPDELQAAISQDKEAQDRAEKEAYDREHFNRLREFEA
jgi:hypothetical protein